MTDKQYSPDIGGVDVEALAECFEHGELRGRNFTQIFNSAERRLVAATLRDLAQPKQECRHPNRFGSGTCSTDGSGTLSWHCQACGASGHDSWGPMIPSTEHK